MIRTFDYRRSLAEIRAQVDGLSQRMLTVTLPTLLAGGHVVLLRGFDAGAVLDAIARHRITLAFAVPAMLLFMSQHPGFAAADLPCRHCFRISAQCSDILGNMS